MKERLANLTAWLRENNTDFAFITNPDHVFYFSGFLSDPHERLLGVAVFQKDEPFLICPNMEVNEAKKAGWSHDIIGYSDIDDPWEYIEKRTKARIPSVHSIAIEKEHLTVARSEQLSNLFPEAKLISAEEKLRQLRLYKSEEELAKIRQACSLADDAIAAGVQEIKEGRTEMEVLAAIEYDLKKKGVQEMAFSTMVLTGKNAASPHGTPGNTKIQKGDLILFDLGVVFEGYCSDITRTVAYHDINKEQERIYQTVLRAQQEAIDKIKPKTAASEIDLAARQVIDSAGYGKYFPHRLGHGLGISVHEYPSMTETNPLPLAKGMVFTVEPGIYVPNVAGVRIEDDVVVTDKGAEILTKFPKELQIIP